MGEVLVSKELVCFANVGQEPEKIHWAGVRQESCSSDAIASQKSGHEV
jgi:hypothetical protein